MTHSVIFVHGTGVRGSAYSESFIRVKSALHGIDDQLDVQGCFWGGTEGVRLNANGASIPTYQGTGGEEPSAKDEEIALWAVLYIDPWYELRLLGDWKADTGELPPNQLPPAQALRQQLQNYTPSDALHQALARNGLIMAWDQAKAALLVSTEYQSATESAPPDPNDHRRVIARALLAKAAVLAEEAGQPGLQGEARDELVGLLVNELHGYGYGLASWLTRPFKGMAMSYATRRVRRARGAISDAASPNAGDILLYQARGDRIRGFIRNSTANAPGDSVTLLAHSLGGIACVDLLIQESLPKVQRLITVGSQSPFMYEINALVSLRYGAALPPHFPRWLNIYDERDFLSYVGAGVFVDRVQDVRVDNGQPFPQSHSAYWTNPDVWKTVAAFLS